MANDAVLMFPEIVDNAPMVTGDHPHDIIGNADTGNLLKYYRPLYQAATKGDWNAVKEFLYSDPDAKIATITGFGETVLHVAAWTGNAGFIEKFLKILPREALERQSHNGMTALHVAAAGGNLHIVKALVKQNPSLTQIVEKFGHTPLLMAAHYGRKEVVRYLCLETKDEPPSYPFSGPNSSLLAVALTRSGDYDILISLVSYYPILVAALTSKFFGENLLSVLAAKPADFRSGSCLSFWEKCIYQLVPAEVNYEAHHIAMILDDKNNQKPVACFTVISQIYNLLWTVLKYLIPRIKHIMEEKLNHKYTEILVHCACKVISGLDDFQLVNYFSESEILYQASASGIVEIVTICLHYFPYLYWIRMRGKSIFHVAIEYRREKIFNLVYEGNAANKLLSNRNQDGETSLHIVAKLAPFPQLSSIPCSALQMQREMQWFQAVENFIQPFDRDLKNIKGLSASELFTSEHAKLAEQAEHWMRETSASCMVVSTLIATVAFAAAFTVPGGIDSDKGIPIFLTDAPFAVFAISIALALFSSTTSLLMFVSTLAARYAKEDYLSALPMKLIFGFASLFIAIAAMMVAFGSAFQIMLSERWKWVYFPTTIVGAIPVALFMMLQLPLFIQMVWSTFGPNIFRPKRIW